MQGYIGSKAQPGAASAASGAPGEENVLRTRVLSAVVIGFITVLTALLGGTWFSGFLLIAVIAAAYEMVGLMRVSGFKPSLAFCFAITALLFATVRLPTLSFLPLLFTFVLLGSLAWQMRHREGKPIADWAITLAGGAYLGWTGGHMAAIREFDQGIWWLVMAIGITWLADSGAFFVGRRFGRHKLAPMLSPKKTWEGYIGGVVAAILGGLLVGALSPLGPVHGAIAAFLVGALGTLGDLAESMFKRQADVKDSGHLIPGHGGVFDRIDSLLWAGVIVFYYVTLFYR
jgi:phosphatidate cytidylyltransferase